MEKMKHVSKFLSLVLRHKPENIGIKLDKNGWVPVNELLTQLEVHKRGITFDELKEVIESNDKKRFEFNDDETKIRASQGHSVKVDLQLKSERPPNKLYHGTINKNVDTIMVKGLSKMNRHAVHLSDNLETATSVGSRRGEAVILVVDSAHMYTDGFKFFKSKNGVWLTDNVPSKYIKPNV